MVELVVGSGPHGWLGAQAGPGGDRAAKTAKGSLAAKATRGNRGRMTPEV